MNSSEAATYAQSRGFPTVTADTIRRHAGTTTRLLTAYTAGRHRIRVRREDVDRWLETRPWNQYGPYRDAPP